jgi:glycosyltransferase involved in cell wall biosynthesis
VSTVTSPLTASKTPPEQALPLRVAVVTDGLYPFFKGGKEVRHHELLRRAVRSDVHVDVYTMKWWEGASIRQESGITYRALCRAWPMYSGDRRSVTQAIIFAVASMRLLFMPFDLIDADHMPYLQLFPLRVVAKLRRVPLVVTWHEWWGSDYWGFYLGRLGFIAATVERRAALGADHMLVATSQTAECLYNAGVSPERVSVLPLGIDFTEVKRSLPSEQTHDVLYIGRLLEHKCIHVLLSAIALLRDDGLLLTCGIFGLGPESSRLVQMVAQLNLEGQVQLHAPLEQQGEVFSLMKAARVFCYPSVREGFGLAVIESLACGTPVVTTNHWDNQARHLIEDGKSGVVCGPDPISVAHALREALEIPALSPEEFESEKWDWQQRANELVDVYRAVISDQ